MSQPAVRVAVVGAGRMGYDHIERLTTSISGVEVTAIVEPNETRARAAANLTANAQLFPSVEAAITAKAMDAVLIATPGHIHEAALMPILEARLPVLCEKPLTEDSESSRRIVEAEQKLDRPHIQVGFTRRFDPEYGKMRELIISKEAGELLMLRCVHRNPSVPDTYRQDMLIADSVVHEFDATAWLAGAAVRNVEVRYGKRNSLAAERLHEPILAIFELTNDVLVDVEMNVSVQFGYQVTTEAVFEKGVARFGDPSGLEVFQNQIASLPVHHGHSDRFNSAFNTELQTWVNAVASGKIVDGPNAWDGYQAARACEAGVQALNEGKRVDIPVEERPAFYA